MEIDLSNATELGDAAAKAVAEARNLERLWLGRCKMITDIGVGCIAVGCKKLKLVSLKWCVGVGDLGVGLIAVKCKEIRSLDLSFVPVITNNHTFINSSFTQNSDLLYSMFPVHVVNFQIYDMCTL